MASEDGILHETTKCEAMLRQRADRRLLRRLERGVQWGRRRGQRIREQLVITWLAKHWVCMDEKTMTHQEGDFVNVKNEDEKGDRKAMVGLQGKRSLREKKMSYLMSCRDATHMYVMAVSKLTVKGIDPRRLL